MVKKNPRQEDSQPFDYFANERTSRKQNALPSDNIYNKLRGDMLPSTDASPTKDNILLRINFKIVLGILLALLILGLIAFSVNGVGRQKLEKSLFGLYGIEPSSTLHATRTDVLSSKPGDATKTPTIKPTKTPTNTSTVIVISSPTAPPPTAPPPTALLPSATTVMMVLPSNTPIPSSPTTCRNVGSITLAEVGQTLCVQGTVRELIEESTNFMVVFSSEKGAFYWVTYDMVWSSGEVDQCYQVRGKIDRIANSPVLVFNYSNIPIECPE